MEQIVGVAQLYFMPHPLLEIVQRLMAHPVDLKTIASINKRLEASSAYINTGLSEHFQINLGRYLGFVVGTSWNNESAKSK